MSDRKLFFKGLFGILIVLGFVSCGKSQNASAEDTLDRIRRTGVIEACTAIDPPFSDKDAKTGEFSGLYVDAMNIIAQKMNAKVHWHETTFGNVIGEIAAGRCDVMVSDLYANIPRAVTIAFTSPPLGYMGLGILVRTIRGFNFWTHKALWRSLKKNITSTCFTSQNNIRWTEEETDGKSNALRLFVGGAVRRIGFVRQNKLDAR